MNDDNVESSKRRGPTSERGREWEQIQELMRKYFDTQELRYKDAATALLWRLGVQDLISIARKKGINPKDFRWQPPARQASDGLAQFVESVLASMLAGTGVETLLVKHSEYDHLGLRSWMSQRMEWKMFDKLRQDHRKRHVPLTKNKKGYQEDGTHDVPEESRNDPLSAHGDDDSTAGHMDFEVHTMYAEDSQAQHEPQVDEDEVREQKILFTQLVTRAELDVRELEALIYYLQEYERKEAAETMNISEESYKALLEKIKRKLKRAASDNA